MQVVFEDRELAICAGDRVYATKTMGLRRATVYYKRLDSLRQAGCLQDLKSLPGRFHELKGNRAGEWACDLDHPYRLVFKPLLNQKGEIIGLLVEQTVLIIEIVDYHK